MASGRLVTAPQFFRNFSPLNLTLPDRNPPPPSCSASVQLPISVSTSLRLSRPLQEQVPTAKGCKQCQELKHENMHHSQTVASQKEQIRSLRAQVDQLTALISTSNEPSPTPPRSPPSTRGGPLFAPLNATLDDLDGLAAEMAEKEHKAMDDVLARMNSVLTKEVPRRPPVQS